MTAEAFIKILNEQPKGAVLMVTGDDGVASMYIKPDEEIREVIQDFISEEIKLEDIKTYGSEEYDHVLVTHGFILNKKTGKRDIPVKVYRSLTTIRDIMVLENIKDKKNINIEDLYVI